MAAQPDAIAVPSLAAPPQSVARPARWAAQRVARAAGLLRDRGQLLPRRAVAGPKVSVVEHERHEPRLRKAARRAHKRRAVGGAAKAVCKNDARRIAARGVRRVRRQVERAAANGAHACEFDLSLVVLARHWFLLLCTRVCVAKGVLCTTSQFWSFPRFGRHFAPGAHKAW